MRLLSKITAMEVGGEEESSDCSGLGERTVQQEKVDKDGTVWK